MIELQIMQWVIGGLVLSVAGTAGFLWKRTEKKVSMDVFEEYKLRNDMSHRITHTGIREIKRGQKEIWNKMDDKQDKQ